MSPVKLRKSYALRAAALAIAAASFAAPAAAQQESAHNDDVLKLLLPFTTLNSTAVGQQTLNFNLFGTTSGTITNPTAGAIGINNNATAAQQQQAVLDNYILGNNQHFIIADGAGSNLKAILQNSAASNGVLNNFLNVVSTISGGDSSTAKNFLANGTFNGKNQAVNVRPTDLGGIANVYDTYYKTVINPFAGGSNPTGDSRPFQVAGFDVTGQPSIHSFTATYTGPNINFFGTIVNTGDLVSNVAIANQGLTTNNAAPSGHTTFAYTDALLLGMLIPQNYQQELTRASEYGNSRIVLGAHYPIDVILSRSLATFDVAQMLANNPDYTKGSSIANFQAGFAQAQADLNKQIQTQCPGQSASACFTPDTRFSNAAQNQADYASRLSYGLPVTAGAPKELTDREGRDASILLATVYGGTSQAAQGLLSQLNITGGTLGSLSTGTINQIIANTESDPITAFANSDLSYWSRLNLYNAIGYFQNVTGTITLASTDQLKTDVTVAKTGVLAGSGSITGNVVFQAGGALGAQGNGTTSYSGLSVNGAATFQAGSKVELTGVFLPGISYTILTTTTGNKISLDPSVIADTSASGNLMTLFTGSLQVLGDPALVVLLTANFGAAAQTPNQLAVANALSSAANAGNFGPNGATLLANLIGINTVATAPAAFNALSGEGLTGQQQTALNAGNVFVTTVLGQATFWSDDRSNDIFGLKDGGSLKDAGYQGAFAARSRAWASGFGQYANLDGQSTAGTAALTSHSSGVATGIDYEVNRNILAGIAGGYSNSSFSVSDRATTGTVDGGHFGVYGVARSGSFYVAGVAEYAHYDNTANRLVAGVGPVQEEKAKFTSDEWLARFEAGYKRESSGVNVTPFAGFQVAQLSNGAFSETGVGGVGVLGLHVNAQTIDSDKSFAGVQFDSKTVVGEGWVLTPYARFSWEHEFSTDRRNTAFLLTLPSSGFTVSGASAAEDAFRFNTGFKLDINTNVAVFAGFDSESSDRGNTYTGTGGIKFRW
jgi:outer membrane autotransporter protein